MKAVGFASVLASALSEAQSFTDRSHSIEAIRNVLIEAEGNSLRVTGMNLATGFTTSVEAQVGEGGRMVIPGEISDILKTCEGSVSLASSGTKLHVQTDGFKGAFSSINGDDYPGMPSPSNLTGTATIDAGMLDAALALTTFTAGDEESMFTGNILFRFKSAEKKLTLVATDGIRFSVVTIPIAQTSFKEEIEVLIPRKSADSIRRPLKSHSLKSDDRERVKVGITRDRKMLVYGDGFSWFASRVDCKFPDISSVLPKSAACIALLNTQEFLQNCRRLIALSKMNRSKQVLSVTLRFEPDGGTLALNSQVDEVGSGSTVLEAQFGKESASIDVCLNISYLTESLSALHAQGVAACQLTIAEEDKTPITITGSFSNGIANLMGISRMRR
jgi:DNA polymerase III sliding clamp (beta) subunit (PCNA family)